MCPISPNRQDDKVETNEDSLSICIIGAGVSGICAGIQLEKQLGVDNYVIFEENEEVGGTWLQNKYPGCACDVASHLYSFSFAPNPNWSSLYAPQEEILEYVKAVARNHGLYSKIKFNHHVKRVEWIEQRNKWALLVIDRSTGLESEHTFDILMPGVGGLRVPNIPKEFESFKGPMMHSAQWNNEIKLEGKGVGLVGSGASAVQIIPCIVDKVKTLFVYQRKPAWVVPRIQFEFPGWVKRLFEIVPPIQTAFRASLFFFYEMSHGIYTPDSYINQLGTKIGLYHLNKEIGEDEKMKANLRPDYSIGCKRITPSERYYAALKHPNAKVNFSRIETVGKDFITTEDGTRDKLDVLILATGFRVQDLFAPLEVYGSEGVNILNLWKTEGPSAYLGICTYNLPNCFFIVGPNSAVGNTSLIFSTECQVNWAIQVIREMIEKKYTRVRVDEHVEKEYMKGILAHLKGTVWGAKDCGNWYTDHRGVVTAVNPNSGITYWRQTRRVDFTQLIFK